MKKLVKISSIILGILVLVAIVWTAVVIIINTGTHPYVPSRVNSPDGTKVIIPTINFDKEDYDKYLKVHIEIQDTRSGETLFQVQTIASDRMRWSVSWIGNEIVIMNSSDIGSYCWKDNNVTWKETECP